jgi:hypothetical protein
MRYTFLFFLLLLFSCESGSFDKDKRQIAAKDAIREQLPRASRQFEIIRFGEDTLPSWRDTVFNQPIRYILDFRYKDSTETVQQRRGYVVFTPDGKSIIQSQITRINEVLN